MVHQRPLILLYTQRVYSLETFKIGLNFFVQCLLSYKEDINPHLDTSAKRFGYIIVRFKDGSSCQLEDFQTLHKLFCSVSSTEDGRKKQKISHSLYSVIFFHFSLKCLHMQYSYLMGNRPCNS